MEELWSNKSYNSRLTSWVDGLLRFNFNIEYITGARMCLVVHTLRQPYQKAKFTNKYDEDFAAVTIIRILDAAAAISVNSAP